MKQKEIKEEKVKYQKYDEKEDVFNWEKKHGKVIYIGKKIELPRWLK